MWNPYEVLSSGTRVVHGVGAVIAAIALWSTLSLTGVVESVLAGSQALYTVSTNGLDDEQWVQTVQNSMSEAEAKLPAPWEVFMAFGPLIWSAGTDPITDEAPLPQTLLAGTLEKGQPLPAEQCASACAELVETTITDCEVDWTDEELHPDGVLWCKGEPPAGQSLLLRATLWSVGRVVLSGLLVVLIGVPIGVIMGSSARVNAALSPLVDPFRSAPIVAINPILILWLGIGEVVKIVFLMMGAIVYLVPMVRDAIQAVPQTYWIAARDLGATPREAIQHSVLPMAMPRIADAVIVSVSIMWTYITVAEYINAEVGLGQLIQNARRFSAMDQVFAGIFVIIALALFTYQGMSALKHWLYPWENEV
jgi:ABC-type nitrate/sulfonate/bicarbonate transport system permease component